MRVRLVRKQRSQLLIYLNTNGLSSFVAVNSEVTLEELLVFFSGCNKIPPCGFGDRPRLNFSSEDVFPTASTCVPMLTLPTRYHNDPQAFYDKVVYAIQNHGGFGLA